MGVALLTAEGQNVDAFDSQRSFQRLGDRVYERLDTEVLGKRKVAAELLDVPPRGDDRVAQEGRIPRQERDGLVIGVDGAVAVLRISREVRIHETGTHLGPL